MKRSNLYPAFRVTQMRFPRTLENTYEDPMSSAGVKINFQYASKSFMKLVPKTSHIADRKLFISLTR
jgi:hypothetical protein